MGRRWALGDDVDVRACARSLVGSFVREMDSASYSICALITLILLVLLGKLLHTLWSVHTDDSIHK